MKKETYLNNNKYIAIKILILLLLVIGMWILITMHLIYSLKYNNISNNYTQDYIWLLCGVIISSLLYLNLLKYIKRVEITEQILGRTKKELQLIIDSMPAMIWYKDKNNYYLRVNKQVAKTIGLPPEKIAGKSATEIYPDLGEAFFREDLEIFKTGKPIIKQITKLPVVSGGYIWIQRDKIPYYDNEGNISGIIVFSVDITDKLTKEDELNQKTIMLETLLDTIPAYVYLKDKNLTYIKANKESYNNLGLKPEEIIGKTDNDIFPKKQAEENNRIDSEVIRSEKIIRNFVQKISTPDGKDSWISRYKSPFRNQEGKVLGLVGISINVTEQMKLEEKLMQKIMEQEALLNTIPAYVYYKDSNLKYIVTNRAFAEMYNKVPEDMIGRDDSELCKKTAFEHHRKIDLEILEKGLPKIGLIEKNNNRWLSTNKFPYRDNNGQIKGVVGIAFDITEQTRTENELKSIIQENKKLLDDIVEYDKIKTAFFSNISHEFKTPLNVILSTLQLISTFKMNCDNDCSQKIGRYTGIMKQNCFRLLRLINNLIDVTKIESGFLNMDVHNYNIVNIIEETTLSISAFAQNHGISLEFDTQIEEKTIACDADKIERTILNLLSNAVKFTKRGGKIWVKVKSKKDKIIFSIKDTGIGIPEDKLEAIFSRFSQINQSLTRDHEGSGIGLYLVKSLVEMHGGSISVKSEIGKGTEFTVEIPLIVLPEDNNDYNNITYQEIASTAGIEFSDIY
jgi:PAS domain S-box-containing protein